MALTTLPIGRSTIGPETNTHQYPPHPPLNTNDTNENTTTLCEIAEHWDTSGEIHAGSNAAAEFARWQEHAAENPQEWTGNEFTLGDFESYIAEARSQYDAPTDRKSVG